MTFLKFLTRILFVFIVAFSLMEEGDIFLLENVVGNYFYFQLKEINIFKDFRSEIFYMTFKVTISFSLTKDSILYLALKICIP